MRYPSPATALSILAIVIATSGTSYAVTQLPRNSVGAGQIKTGAVGAPEVKDGSLTKDDFAAGQAPAGSAGPVGATGATGAAGPQGAPGRAADESQFFTRLESDARYVAGSSGQVDVSHAFAPPYRDSSSTQVLQAGSLIGGTGMRLSMSLCSLATQGRPVSESRVLLGVQDANAPGTSSPPKEYVVSSYDGAGRAPRVAYSGTTFFVYAGEGLAAASTAGGSNLASTFTIDVTSPFDRSFVIHLDGSVRWTSNSPTVANDPNGCHVTAVATKGRSQS